MVIFDVEGVLLPKRRYILFQATRRLGFRQFFKIILFGILYEISLIQLKTALRWIFGCFKGFTIHELYSYYQKMPLLPGVTEVFSHLHQKGWKTCLISSGLPQLFVRELAEKLKADCAFGVELETMNGRFTGRITGDVIEKDGKAKVLRNTLSHEQFNTQSLILVADDRNNLPLFPYVGLRIGYNPDFKLTLRSDYVVTGKLTEILPVITGGKPGKSEPFLSRNDLLRSAIHMSGFAIPFISRYFLDHYMLIFLIGLVTMLYIISELARILDRSFPVFTWITNKATVRLEPYEFATNPIFYALGITLSLMFFPSPIGYAAIATLTLGDGFASLLGKKYGRNSSPFNKTKSLEGSLFGLLFAFLGTSFFLTPAKALLAAASGMLIESIPTPINDNLTIPLTVSIVLSIAAL
jgi:HAD superfamily phosphoserine phosphatase-like hydrolase